VLLAVSAQSHYVSLVNRWQSVNRSVHVEQMAEVEWVTCMGVTTPEN